MSRPKNIAKVLKERINKPLDTTREIAKNTGIDHSTVARIDKQLPQIATKSNIILDICKMDIDIVKLGQKEIKRRFEDQEELKKIRATEISQIIRENTARYSIFKGDITDEDGGLRRLSLEQLKDMSEEELNEYRKTLLK